MRGLRKRGHGRAGRPLQLGADRRGGEEDDRRRRQGAQGGLQGGRGAGGRALLPLQGLDARARARVARPQGGAAAARGAQAGQDRDRRGPRGAGALEDALSYCFSAASTARFAMTVIRCARYSGEACRSLLRPSGFTLMLATDSGANFAPSAFSISAWRNTTGPAPVTATRTLPPPKSATNTPTSAKRDAGFLNFM